MQTQSTSPLASGILVTTLNLEARKLLLIQQIAILEDEAGILSLENMLRSILLSDDENYAEDTEGMLDKSEMALVEKRLARYMASPEKVAPFDVIYQKLVHHQ